MTTNRGPRTAADGRELRLWRVGWALTVIFTAAILAAGSIFYSLIALLDFQEIGTTAKLDAKTLFDLVKLSFGVVAGAGALVALVVAYRRQRVDEAGAHREATRLHTERFSQAVDKLGSDSPAVRLGGVHALAGLADDAPDDNLRQTCIDVLCAYLRLPFPRDPGDLPDGSSLTEEQRSAHQTKQDLHRALREVRHTVLRLIGDHYRIPQGTYRSWQGRDLDLTGVTIDGPMDFKGAVFSSGNVSFARAEISSDLVTFNGAVFSGGNVSFSRASFSSGDVIFSNAEFSDGTVNFGGAMVSGGLITFNSARFSGGEVSMLSGRFTGGRVVFGGASFCGSRVIFGDVRFSGGTMVFGGAEFSGGVVTFYQATFSGGSVEFGDASFSTAILDFDGATFSGGRMSLHATTGLVPTGLLAAVGTPVPSEIRLRADWLPAGP
ncbi:pentapeptide repeat-containing protein [Streptomyces pratensis]|nr:pentapeptide repeat-containing protein [Streptomyces pratensis]